MARLRRAGATGELIMRFDSGFWSNTTIATLERLDVGYTMGVRMVKSVLSAVAAIDEGAWTPIEYTPDGMAEVAECAYKGRRLIVRRTRLVGAQATLWPQWRHFAFVTDLEATPSMSTPSTGPTPRRTGHQGPQGRERDSSTSLRATSPPTPPGSSAPPWPTTSSAGPPCWVSSLPRDQLVVARTIRTRYLSVPGRLDQPFGTPDPARSREWPWATEFARALVLLRALPPVPV